MLCWNIYGRWYTIHIQALNFFECLEMLRFTSMSHCYKCLYLPKTFPFSLITRFYDDNDDGNTFDDDEYFDDNDDDDNDDDLVAMWW